MSQTPLDMDTIRHRLDEAEGPQYWRSLEEAAQTDAFFEAVKGEFPAGADELPGSVSRRSFLHVMGASLALAGVTSGCSRQPREAIFPYVKPPEEVIPGKPLYFATSFVMGGYATGVLAESHMGRPTKIEGLPNHPSSQGATDIFAQASVLDLYDPDRSRVVRHTGAISRWDDFTAAMKGHFDNARPKGGEGIRLLTETITSPTVYDQIQGLLKDFPKAKWHQYEPAGRDNVREGGRMAFGTYVEAIYHFDKAQVILALDSDFLLSGPGHVRYARDFAQGRDFGELSGHGNGNSEGHGSLNRLYAVESTPTNTGGTADHRYSLRPSQIEGFVRYLAEKLGVNALPTGESGLSSKELKWADAIAKDLEDHGGHSIVVVGDQQPPVVHALAHAINDALGNTGRTVVYTASVEPAPIDQLASLQELTSDMAAGEVELLLIIGGNPVYNAPGDLAFASALDKVPARAHLSAYVDETSEICHWHGPLTHYLETWGDARAHDGTVSLTQPLISPFYDGRSPSEVLSAILDEAPRTAHEIVRDYWKKTRGEKNFDKFWAHALSLGVIEGTAFKSKKVRLAQNVAGDYIPPAKSKDFEVVFLPDPSVHDGVFANNAWLQELSKPLSKLTWDNAVFMAMSTAERLRVSDGDLVEISIGDTTQVGPVLRQPGHSLDTVTLHLGYGRRVVGKVGKGKGFDANTLRTVEGFWMARGAKVTKVSGTYPLAKTEEYYNMEGRGLVREFTLADYEEDSHIVQEGYHEPTLAETLYDPAEKAWDRNSWGMTIDLNKCTACNACIIACQAENNIAVVGKDEVGMGREMQWIRVDRYYGGRNLDEPSTHFQPVPCMQCENAPCELVCPVGATQHSREGLNEMVYNRCIGTRYCSNNCPYKVRRFNFYNYNRTPQGRGNDGPVYPEVMKQMYNPDVTVRTRGVMEKCTYCVQRINRARIEAKNERRPITDSHLSTACQQVCASGAIAFGNINNPESHVARLKQSHRNYSILGDLNTRPRTTYLARLRNPNEELEA